MLDLDNFRSIWISYFSIQRVKFEVELYSALQEFCSQLSVCIPQVCEDLCTIGLQFRIKAKSADLVCNYLKRSNIEILTPARTLVMSRTRMPASGSVSGRGAAVE